MSTSTCLLSFIGFYENGTKLPIAQAATYEFQVGLTDVIRGWSLGVMGMCLGEIRKLTIPAHLAYGERGAGPLIPGRNEDKKNYYFYLPAKLFYFRRNGLGLRRLPEKCGRWIQRLHNLTDGG